MPFLGLAIFDDLFLQALILLDEHVQTDIKLPTDSDEISNIRDPFPLSQRAMAERETLSLFTET